MTTNTELLDSFYDNLSQDYRPDEITEESLLKSLAELARDFDAAKDAHKELDKIVDRLTSDPNYQRCYAADDLREVLDSIL